MDRALLQRDENRQQSCSSHEPAERFAEYRAKHL
jgi:hypothetical protein